MANSEKRNYPLPDYDAPSTVGPAPGQPNASFPPPAYNQYPAAPGQNQAPMMTTVVISQPILGRGPMNLMCPGCRQNVVSETKAVYGSFTWWMFWMLCIFGCWCGCCLIPFCTESLKDVEHSCPQCKASLGTFKRR